MASGFSLEQQSLDDARHVVAVVGDVNLVSAHELKRAVLDAVAAGRTRLVIDLTPTTLLDSAGLGVLVAAGRVLREHDGALAIVNNDPDIARTLELTGLDRVFTICASRDAAIRAVGAGSS